MCKHFLNKAAPDTVSVTTVDRLGMDLRVKARDLTDEFRIGFRQTVRANMILLLPSMHSLRCRRESRVTQRECMKNRFLLSRICTSVFSVPEEGL